MWSIRMETYIEHVNTVFLSQKYESPFFLNNVRTPSCYWCHHELFAPNIDKLKRATEISSSKWRLKWKLKKRC